MDRYFAKFPIIEYNETQVRDISRSVRLTPEARAASSLYHPLQVQAGFRADNLSEAYYQDPEMDWLLYITNDMVDPFYDWYMSEREFENFIVKKYGSYEDAQKQIMFYRNNWYKLDEPISKSHYDNNIAPGWKKYYTPVFGPKGSIINYKRREEDWVMNTNRIIQYVGVAKSGDFANGEIIDIYSNTQQLVGQGTSIFANSDYVIIQHVSGNTVANSTVDKTLTGQTSGESWHTYSSNNLHINISDDEAVFWDPITAFDLEFESNERKKNLYVMNADYALDLSEQIRIKLKDTI